MTFLLELTLKEIIEHKSEFVELLKAGRFPLRKWVSNHPDVSSDVPQEQQAAAQFLTWHQTVSMLGDAWQPLLAPSIFSTIATLLRLL